MPGDYLALRLQTNRIMGSLGTHDNGSRFPGKSNPLQTCPFFFLIWIAQGSVEEEDTTKSKTAKGKCKDN